MNDIATLAEHCTFPSGRDDHAQARQSPWFDLLGQRRSSP